MNPSLSLFLCQIKKIVFLQVLFLFLMSVFRIVFFYYYNTIENYSLYYNDIFNAFVLGLRIDLTVIGYAQVLPTLVLIILYYLKSKKLNNLFIKITVFYFLFFYLIISFLAFADFAFYSFFKDHINILFFGILDDDTKALAITMWQNYNIPLISLISFTYIYFLYKIIVFILHYNLAPDFIFTKLKFPIFLFIFIILVNFLAIRGTFGMYPLGKMIPNLSVNEFVNKIPQNGFRAFVSAYKIRKKYLKREYDIIKETGYKGNIKDAFKVLKGSSNIDEKNLLNNIKKTTKKVNDKDYNVVIIMVESFGMPILKYNSKDFNIMGELKKHFDKDILLTNFISAGDGTISSLESLLLNIPYRPNTFALSQSIYAQTRFNYSPAFLYNNASYDTSFIYGGDLSWRNLGKFIKFQDYDNIEGKIDIFNNLKLNKDIEDTYFHPWGIYDEYLYTHILKKLENSSKKQFIFALSTNNHPPYNIPNNYKKNKLEFSSELKNHITHDIELSKQRFTSYAYALDSLGKFLTDFKKSKFSKNTIIVVTADNNTVDGIMKYDDNRLLNSKNIPLYFYLPQELKDKLTIDTKVSGSHKDIFPTLYNLTLENTSYLSIGNNLFDSNLKHYGFNGSMVVTYKNEITKIKKLNRKIKEHKEDYYKASLAVTQYLINKTYQKGK